MTMTLLTIFFSLKKKGNDLICNHQHCGELNREPLVMIITAFNIFVLNSQHFCGKAAALIHFCAFTSRDPAAKFDQAKLFCFTSLFSIWIIYTLLFVLHTTKVELLVCLLSRVYRLINICGRYCFATLFLSFFSSFILWNHRVCRNFWPAVIACKPLLAAFDGTFRGHKKCYCFFLSD